MSLLIKPYSKVSILQEVEARRLIEIDRTQDALGDLHRDVLVLVTKSRSRAIAKHNAKTNVQEAKFEIGDFVLIPHAQKKGHKLQFIWKGPPLVIRVKSDCVYEVEDLVMHKQKNVHSRRLAFY